MKMRFYTCLSLGGFMSILSIEGDIIASWGSPLDAGWGNGAQPSGWTPMETFTSTRMLKGTAWSNTSASRSHPASST
ncbi:MAG: hypothetical protein Ct9H300mP11_17210 [Chloroflexota bacterium]|nr:MAG: hypothetical protein Ct9H300mP11_17210 [Chloroflexota bacterium]